MKPSPLSDDVLITLRQIMRAIAMRSKRLMQKVGLTSPQMLILKEILRFGQVGVGMLAGNVNLSQATVTSILDRLESKKLVLRTRSALDKRKVLVELTDAGKEILQSSPPLLHEEFVQEFEKLQEWEQLMMLANLKRIAAMMHVRPAEEIPVLDPAEIIHEPI